MDIYIRRDNEDFGPYSKETALEYVRQGIFLPADYAWHEGLPEWQPVGQLVGMTSARPAPARVPVRNPSAALSADYAPINPAQTGLLKTQNIAQANYRPAKRKSLERPKKRGFWMALNIVLIIVAVAVAYVRLGSGGRYTGMIRSLLHMAPAQGAQEETAAPLPAPVPIVSAPAPVAKESASAPAATPEAPAAPPAPAKAFDAADLAQNPGAWPQVVALREATDFPAILDGQAVGKVTVPAGGIVQLIGIVGEELKVQYQGGQRTVPWRQTDLEERATRNGASTAAAH